MRKVGLYSKCWESSITMGMYFPDKWTLSQIRYSLVVILELNGVSEVQYKEVMIIDDE